MHSEGATGDRAGPRREAREVLWGPLTRNRRTLSAGYLLLMAWQLGEALVPVTAGIVIDRGVATGDSWGFAWSSLLLIAVFFMLSLGYRFGGRICVRVVQEESHRLRLRISEHVLDPRGAHTRDLAGGTLSLATSDADQVAEFVRQLGHTLAALSAIAIAAVYLVGVDPLIAVVVLSGLPITIAITQLISPMVARRTTGQQAAIARTSGLAGDLIKGIRPIKGIGAEDAASRRYRRVSLVAQSASVSTARSWGYLSGVTTLIAGLFLALVAWLAGARALDGDMSLGALIAIVGLTQFLAEPITALGHLSAQAAASWASSRRIADFLATPPIIAEGDAEPAGLAPQLLMAGVCTPALQDVSLTTQPGELLALVVEDQVAADELMALLAGEILPAQGHLWLGDVALCDLTIRSRRRTMLVAPHHAAIPEGTLRSIVDPAGTLSAQRLHAVLQASAAEDVVTAHPAGLEHHVREHGSSLSGGQRQRLALARALGHDRPILVLHDPTSAVDAVTEQHIAAGLRRDRAGDRATILLTSSPVMLAAADRVMWIRGGRTVARGSHADLLGDADYRSAVLR